MQRLAWDSERSAVQGDGIVTALIAILDRLHRPLESHFNDEVARIANLAASPKTLMGDLPRKTPLWSGSARSGGRPSLMEPGVTDVLGGLVHRSR
ncbi:hypothetical protein BM221_006967 [Beauveria bassiana]|uniref:Uncharacterized protein n=1 Tax=Beauveria bassiana TaxID=176275 RepID=A0A2N6NJ41_BEABA|nr:hypothetical protein BM221_006967 [Beauveria bassiana]